MKKMFAAGILALCTVATRAEYEQVNLTVFGMDCAPCTHAIPVSMKGIRGVNTVDVDLNTGLVTIKVTPETTLLCASSTTQSRRTALRTKTLLLSREAQSLERPAHRSSRSLEYRTASLWFQLPGLTYRRFPREDCNHHRRPPTGPQREGVGHVSL